MSISREDLANIVGTAPEMVIRTLSDFKDETHMFYKHKHNINKISNMWVPSYH